MSVDGRQKSLTLCTS